MTKALKKSEEDFQQNFPAILDTIAQGETVFHAMAKNRIDPSCLTWIFADPKRKEVYEEAQKVAAEVLAHKTLMLAEESPDPEDQYMVGIRQKIYTTLMEKWNHDRYGAKKQIEQTVTVDISGAMEKANLRLAKGVTIEHGETD